MERLIVFDIDGTLTETNTVDTECYAQAVRACLGIQIDTDWSSYRNVTDSGIATELIERHGSSDTIRADLERLRSHFVALLQSTLSRAPNLARPVPGAATAVEALRAADATGVAIATGGWRDAALLKLDRAGIPYEGLPIASADDDVAREAILALACRRAEERAVVPSIGSIVYVGDGVWDFDAARALGIGFVGIGSGDRGAGLRDAGVETVFEDFTDVEAFVTAVSRP